ncbi:hypothetical protein MASR1M90_23700 [Desulfovibrionales bacterium]
MKKIFLLVLIAGLTFYAVNTGSLYNLAREAAWYVLINMNNKNMQFPKQPPQFEEQKQIKTYAPANVNPYKDMGLLTVSTKKDIEISFYDMVGYKKICSHKIKAGSQKQIELKKGSYQAEIKDGKQVTLTTISCISHEGKLDL